MTHDHDDNYFMSDDEYEQEMDARVKQYSIISGLLSLKEMEELKVFVKDSNIFTDEQRQKATEAIAKEISDTLATTFGDPLPTLGSPTLGQ